MLLPVQYGCHNGSSQEINPGSLRSQVAVFLLSGVFNGYSLMIGNNIEEDEAFGFFMNVNDQVVAIFAKSFLRSRLSGQIPSSRTTANFKTVFTRLDSVKVRGSNVEYLNFSLIFRHIFFVRRLGNWLVLAMSLICYSPAYLSSLSSGGQFLRAYVQRFNDPPIKSLVTLGAQHQGWSAPLEAHSLLRSAGVFGFPRCPGNNTEVKRFFVGFRYKRIVLLRGSQASALASAIGFQNAMAFFAAESPRLSPRCFPQCPYSH